MTEPFLSLFHFLSFSSSPLFIDNESCYAMGFITTIPILDLKCTLHQHSIYISDSATTTATPPSSKEHHPQINIQTTQAMWSYGCTGTRSLMKSALYLYSSLYSITV